MSHFVSCGCWLLVTRDHSPSTVSKLTAQGFGLRLASCSCKTTPVGVCDGNQWKPPWRSGCPEDSSPICNDGKAYWLLNVRRLLQSSKLAQVIKEMEAYKINIMGWIDAGIFLSGYKAILFSDHYDNMPCDGVPLFLDNQACCILEEWIPVNKHLRTARFVSFMPGLPLFNATLHPMTMIMLRKTPLIGNFRISQRKYLVVTSYWSWETWMHRLERINMVLSTSLVHSLIANKPIVVNVWCSFVP